MSKRQKNRKKKLSKCTGVSKNERTCSICHSEFDIEGEGGTEGLFGICPVAFCPWCLSSLINMFEQLNCEFCEYKESEKK